MQKSRTVRPTAGVESPTTCRLPLVELLIDTEAELFDLAVRLGLQVLDAMFEEDRTGGGRSAGRATRTKPTAQRRGPGRWPVPSSSGGGRYRSAAPGSARGARRCRSRPSRRWPRPIHCGGAPSSSCWSA